MFGVCLEACQYHDVSLQQLRRLQGHTDPVPVTGSDAAEKYGSHTRVIIKNTLSLLLEMKYVSSDADDQIS